MLLNEDFFSNTFKNWREIRDNKNLMDHLCVYILYIYKHLENRKLEVNYLHQKGWYDIHLFLVLYEFYTDQSYAPTACKWNSRCVKNDKIWKLKKSGKPFFVYQTLKLKVQSWKLTSIIRIYAFYIPRVVYPFHSQSMWWIRNWRNP